MRHVVVLSTEMFVTLLIGDAPFGLAYWARVAGLARVTTAVGGLLLVTVLRFAQVGAEVVGNERTSRVKPGRKAK